MADDNYIKGPWYVNIHGESPTEPGRLDVGPAGHFDGIASL